MVITRVGKPPRSPWRRGLRALMLAWALGSSLWLANSLRTQGLAPAQLQDDARVQVLDAGTALELRPTAGLQPRGLVFFCGSGVGAEAYVPLLRPLAEAGHRVLIVRLPWRFAPLDSHRDEAIARALTLMAAHADTTAWVAAGHSLGGAIAARWMPAAPASVKGLVLVGTTHPKSHDLSGLALPVTKVYADHDEVAAVERVLTNKALLPASTEWLEIQGGNHSQFGHYGHQLFDGDATISREAQQGQTRAALLKALTVNTPSAQSRASAPGLTPAEPSL